jgi:hypothetical protein
MRMHLPAVMNGNCGSLLELIPFTPPVFSFAPSNRHNIAAYPALLLGA